MLREKDFRAFIKEHDWSLYAGKNIAIICNADAIVPTWAYMLLANKMRPYAYEVVFGGLETLEAVLFTRAMKQVIFNIINKAFALMVIVFQIKRD